MLRRVSIAVGTLVGASACAALLAVDDVGYGATPNDAARDAPDGGVADVAADEEASSDAAAGCAPDASFAADPLNCGACGHDCLGAGCASAACLPASIYAGLPYTITSLAVDETTVFWAGGGAGSFYAPKKPGAIKKVQAAPAQTIAVDGTGVYYTDNVSAAGQGLFRCPKPPATCPVPTPLASMMHPGDIALDSANVYFTENGTPGGVFFCPKASGCALGTISTVDDVPAMALGGGSVFWSAGGSVYDFAPDAATLAVFDGGAYQIAADDASVYWANQDDKSLWSCAIADCQAAQVAPSTGGIAALTSDGAFVYGTDQGGHIFRYSAAGLVRLGTVTSGALQAIAVDATAIYIAQNLPGASVILRLAKPP